jgi:hypothetical protein
MNAYKLGRDIKNTFDVDDANHERVRINVSPDRLEIIAGPYRSWIRTLPLIAGALAVLLLACGVVYGAIESDADWWTVPPAVALILYFELSFVPPMLSGRQVVVFQVWPNRISVTEHGILTRRKTVWQRDEVNTIGYTYSGGAESGGRCYLKDLLKDSQSEILLVDWPERIIRRVAEKIRQVWGLPEQPLLEVAQIEQLVAQPTPPHVERTAEGIRLTLPQTSLRAKPFIKWFRLVGSLLIACFALILIFVILRDFFSLERDFSVEGVLITLFWVFILFVTGFTVLDEAPWLLNFPVHIEVTSQAIRRICMGRCRTVDTLTRDDAHHLEIDVNPKTGLSRLRAIGRTTSWPVELARYCPASALIGVANEIAQQFDPALEVRLIDEFKRFSDF